MICPKCGFNNEKNYGFCIRCGAIFSEDEIKKNENYREVNFTTYEVIAFIMAISGSIVTIISLFQVISLDSFYKLTFYKYITVPMIIALVSFLGSLGIIKHPLIGGFIVAISNIYLAFTLYEQGSFGISYSFFGGVMSILAYFMKKKPSN